jgi:hypothetical protein
VLLVAIIFLMVLIVHRGRSRVAGVAVTTFVAINILALAMSRQLFFLMWLPPALLIWYLAFLRKLDENGGRENNPLAKVT